MAIQFKSFKIKEERTNIPAPLQFRIARNPSYVSSLIAGVFSPILHLPQILWFGSLWPLLVSLAKAASFIGVSMWAGITGNANGFRTVGVEERELSAEEKQKALDQMLAGSGFRAVPLHAPIEE